MMSFQDCETKVHSVCENHNGIWKNCVDQPRFSKLTNHHIIVFFFYYRKECTERPVTKEIEKCAKVGFKMSHNFASIITVNKKIQAIRSPKHI